MLPAPLITVVIPVYNPDEIFIETIQSVINQTCQDFEIIIVDDEGINIHSYVVVSVNNSISCTNYSVTDTYNLYIAKLPVAH